MTAPHPDQLREAVERCAEEPIHIPGSIQPHGFLLVLDDQHLRVRQASRNVADWLGLQAEALLGQPLSELLANGALAKRLQALSHEDRNPFHMGDVSFIPAPKAGSFALLAHRHGQQLILEFEPVASDDEAYDLLYPLMRTFVARLHAAQSLTSICELAVQELSRITGFGRVKAYRFDPEGNGEVLAEQAAPGYASYLGHRFPASDIPAQARRLYRENLIRVIPDANYTPSPLLSEASEASQTPLDLGFAALRSVSPVHLQYMRNMGTLASMSVSIVVRDQLWGLISCHDAEPRHVSHRTRTACELLARILALQIDATEAGLQAQRKLELRRHVVHLLSSMADSDSVSTGFRNAPEVALAFATAQGAAVIESASCVSVGHAPPEPLLIELASG